MATRTPKPPLSVETLKHEDATRKNIPTAEYQSVQEKQKLALMRVSYPRAAECSREPGVGQVLDAEKDARDRNLDPQLVWRGKDRQDWSLFDPEQTAKRPRSCCSQAVSRS